ncbi:MAG: hypothetical protein SFW67_16440 [Myxococcaceae bacterium]|nr:hypothetical protein [Myxococcaceae bacterium]
MISLGELVICLVAAALPIGGVVLLVLLVRGTQQKTDLGLNLKVANACPGCGTALPAVRAPKNLRQFMWGGWTCSGCGRELDKWGRALPPS